MNILFGILIAIIIILLFTAFSAWLVRIRCKHKEEFLAKIIGKVSSLINSKIALVEDTYKSGPWYLVIFTKDSKYPIWISHNTIRSVHPDTNDSKIIVKQFNGEDMVIENVDNYELCSTDDMFDYDM